MLCPFTDKAGKATRLILFKTIDRQFLSRYIILTLESTFDRMLAQGSTVQVLIQELFGIFLSSEPLNHFHLNNCCPLIIIPRPISLITIVTFNVIYSIKKFLPFLRSLNNFSRDSQKFPPPITPSFVALMAAFL